MTTTNRTFGPFRGMMPIMATPVDDAREVDLVSQRREVDYCIQCGAVAVGHFALASEYRKIREADRPRILDTVVEQVAGRVPFFAGITGATCADIVRHAREAEEHGADLLMSSLPHAEQLDQPGAIGLFKEIAANTSLRIIIQDTSETAPILTPDVVLQIAQETGQIQAIKAESDDFLTKTADLMERFEGTMQVIGGAGGRHMIHLLRLGVTSFMTGTEAVELHAACVAAYLRGDHEDAASVYYDRILPYLMFYSAPNSLRNLKLMLHMRGILATPHLCAPEDDVAPAYGPTVMREYEWALDRIGWKKTWPNIP